MMQMMGGGGSGGMDMQLVCSENEKHTRQTRKDHVLSACLRRKKMQEMMNQMMGMGGSKKSKGEKTAA